ncbi:MAG: OmpA/MotB domain protein [Bacteroidota bacterium]|jgi:outer membrane protein OmpA-like peptidoglycan-associated protein|nr:OmpA/MotB domain protein [Bacteroidota bacterium]
MKKTVLVFLSVLFFAATSSAQDFLGYINSNYSGVTGVDLNPANVVNSRYKVDVTLVGASLTAYNNYVGLKRSALKKSNDAFNDTSFAEHYLTPRDGNNFNKSIYLSNQIYFPSFLISLGTKNAIAFKTKVRTLMNADGIEPELAKLAYNSLDFPDLWNLKLNNENLSIQTMTWAEYGLSYGHVFKDEAEHFFKAGITAKYIQGIQSAYMNIDNLSYQLTDDTTASLFHTDVSYGHSTSWEGDDVNLGFKNSSLFSWGLDLGVVYEWRPDYEKFKYDMDGETNLWRKDKNKYKLRIGISAVDIGWVKFKKGKYSRDFTADIGYWNLHDFDNVESFDDFDSLLNARYPMNKGDETYKMNLPTALSLQVDYNIYKDFYVNFTPYWSPRFKKDKEKVHDITTFSLTPRWDHKWFGAFIPLSYDVTGNFKAGLALRLGPLVVGTNSFGPWVARKDIYGADAYAMLKIPIMYGHPKDRDKDKVSNKKDLCKDVPGTWEFRGCPDRDGDHIQDKDDVCPDVPGLPKFNGCPDKDGDGIIDSQDACPDTAGLAEFNGCPDRDGDKIIDKDDACPDEAGLALFKGCPDRDGDGTMDKEDRCPDKAGPASNEGCPEVKLFLIDSQGNVLKSATRGRDGSFSFDELPSDESVIFKLEGEDTDDIKEVKVIVGGITKKALRNQDKYFHFIVLKTDTKTLNQEDANDVAIKLNKEEEEVLKKAFNNLEFASAKDIIKQESFSSLDELAVLMAKKPNWRLKISGHTDNQGGKTTNLKLSEKRAKAVQKYLMDKGIAADRFKVEWFGQTKPIADNKTEAGRQKNRRVEMLIIE